MSYTLKNFESHFSQDMLLRGRDYYERGAVLSANEEDGDWLFVVRGTEVYELELGFNKKGKMNYVYCTCPYAEQQDVCKHEVAALYYLRHINDTSIKNGSTAVTKLDDVLNNVSPETVNTFIKEYAAQNKDFAQRLTLYINRKNAEANDSYEIYALQVKEALLAAKGKESYWHSDEWRKLGTALKPLVQLLTKAMKEKDYPVAFHLSAAFIQELSTITAQLHGSYSGRIADIQQQAFKTIEELLLADMAFDLKQHITDWLWQQAASKHYNIIDSQALLTLLEKNLRSTEQEDKYAQIIESFIPPINQPLVKSYYNGYQFTVSELAYVRMLYAFLTDRKKDEKAAAIAVKYAYADNDFFHRTIYHYLNTDKVEKAEQILAERIGGNKQSMHAHATLLLAIAQKKNEKYKICEYAMIIYKKTANKQFLKIYKEQFTAQEWEAHIPEVIKKLKSGTVYPLAITEFYLHENLIDLLLKAVANSHYIHMLSQYTSILVTLNEEGFYDAFVKQYDRAFKYGYNRSESEALETIFEDLKRQDKNSLLEKILQHAFSKKNIEYSLHNLLKKYNNNKPAKEKGTKHLAK